MTDDHPTRRERRSPGRHGFRFRAFLFLTYGLLATFPLVVLGLVGAELYMHAQRSVPQQRLSSASRAVAIATSAFLDEHRRLVALAARGAEAMEGAGPEALDAWLAHTRETAPGLLTLILAGPDGTIVASDPVLTVDGRPIRGMSVADRLYFRVPMETGRPYLSGAFRGRGFGTDPIVAVSEPVGGTADGPAGVVEGSLDLSRIEELARPHLQVPGTRVAIADAAGRLVYASRNTGLERLAKRPPESVCEVGEGFLDDGAPVVGRAASATAGWQVEVCRPAALVHAELRPVRRFLLAWGAVGLVLSLLLSWLGSTLAARPVLASERRFRDLIEESFGLICTHDLDGELLSINPAAAHSLGIAPREAVGRNLKEFLHPAVRDRFREEYLEPIRDEGEAEGLMFVVTAEGDERFWAYRNRLVTEGGDAPFVLGHALDVTERRNAERLLAEQALRDSLTGVGNRARFFDRLELEIDRAEREDTTLALLFLDLDDFKRINDTLGHAAGDAVLRSVGEALKGHVRKVDTVARLGGDEFAVLLPSVGSEDDAVRIAHELVEAVARPVRMGVEELRPRASIGVSLYPANAGDGDGLLADADRAMYHAKRSGRARVHLSRAVSADGQRAG
jgi:diguanylate cyclase (GGDEF)-like protein/PAS domain S-box-containing protein